MSVRFGALLPPGDVPGFSGATCVYCSKTLSSYPLPDCVWRCDSVKCGAMCHIGCLFQQALSNDFTCPTCSRAIEPEERLTALVRHGASLESAVKTLRANMEREFMRNSSERTRLAEANAKVVVLTHTLGEKNETIATIMRELEVLRKANDEMKDSVRNLMSEVEDLKSENGALKVTIAALKSDNRRLKAELEAMSLKVDILQSDMETQKSEYEKDKKEIAANTKVANDKMAKKMAKMEKTMKTMSDRIVELEKKITL